MSENFAELLQQSLTETPMTTGAIIKGRVVDISRDYVLVNVGLKSEALVPIEQFQNMSGELEYLSAMKSMLLLMPLKMVQVKQDCHEKRPNAKNPGTV